MGLRVQNGGAASTVAQWIGALIGRIIYIVWQTALVVTVARWLGVGI